MMKLEIEIAGTPRPVAEISEMLLADAAELAALMERTGLFDFINDPNAIDALSTVVSSIEAGVCELSASFRNLEKLAV